jgi:hypothetical protein
MTRIERIYADFKSIYLSLVIGVNPRSSLVTVAAFFAAYRHLVALSGLIRVLLPLILPVWFRLGRLSKKEKPVLVRRKGF